ncbi:uncharacterized protein TM35_000131750 [Trypanosoma theileri]|uniref:Uncharacterized protein n=1 Tax=Trypanosoma theileri TaxID=67003 RepID=A0A1X0NX30_9TRYP|nr:uncharacterized protein TM35_000131750 [Trypanosoma theileri]ORC89171.1 hypothetical protein TM35_000131750 [Trypanosoma theileri]
MSKKLLVEMLNLHPTMTAALRQVKMHPTPFQVRVLSNIKTDFADVVVDGRAAGGGNQNTTNSNNNNSSNSGGNNDGGALNSRTALTERYTLITVFLGHCLLSTEDQLRCTAVLLANTKDSAAQLRKIMKPFAQLCDIECHVLTQEGRPPSSVLLPSGADAAAAAANNNNNSNSQSSASAGKVRNVIITTLRVLRSWNKELLRSITTFAVEDAGHHNERHLEEILRGITSQPPQPASVSSSSQQQVQGGGGNSSISASNPHNTTKRTANIFLMYLAPLTKVSPKIRYCLNHRNRRYYHLQGPSLSAGAALQTPSGTAPPSSTQLVYLLYLDEKDREELLRRVLQIYQSRRVVILTHHKEIKHLYQTVSKWGLYNAPSESLAGGGGKGSNFMCCMFRTDSRERRDTSLMGFLGDSSTNSSSSTGNSNNDSGNNNNNNNANNKGSSALLVTWDATTEIDLMDVDVLIQYYPPQKSLTERERREYVQVLHTTADPENSRRGRRTMLITFISTNDFTLASFFMGQYGQNGPILNLTPQHQQFERCLNDPKRVLRLKMEKEEERREREKGTAGSSNSAAAHSQQQQQQSQQNTNNSSGSSGGGGGGAAAPLPVPRSRLNVSSATEKKKDQMRSRSNRKGSDKNNRNTSSGRSGGGDRQHDEKKSVDSASRRTTTSGVDGSNGHGSKSGPSTSATSTNTTGRAAVEGSRGSHPSR